MSDTSTQAILDAIDDLDDHLLERLETMREDDRRRPIIEKMLRDRGRL